MEVAQNSLCPLSVYMWSSPAMMLVPPGSEIGEVANVTHHLSQMNFNFANVVQEYAKHVCPVLYHAFCADHIHLRPISPHYFRLLRYGMVLDEANRVVLVAAPRQCADSWKCVTREFDAIFQTSLNVDSTLSSHIHLPEYTFVIYQFPPTTGDNGAMTKDGMKTADCASAAAAPIGGEKSCIPTPLFRLVFRKELRAKGNARMGSAAEPTSHRHDKGAAHDAHVEEMPSSNFVYVLRAVYVSDDLYPPLHKLSAIYNSRPKHGHCAYEAPRPEQTLIVETFSQAMEQLCEVWLQFLDCLAPAWRGKVTLSAAATDKTPARLTDRAHSARQPSESTARAECEDCMRLRYITNGSRLTQRIVVVDNEEGMAHTCHDGRFDVLYYDPDDDDSSHSSNECNNTIDADGSHNNGTNRPATKTATCTRMVFKPSRATCNSIVDGDLCAYMPPDYVYTITNDATSFSQKPSLRLSYATPAMNRLHLWVLNGLVTAETHGVHVLFIKLDITLLLSQCVGLLWERTNENGVGDDDKRQCTCFDKAVEANSHSDDSVSSPHIHQAVFHVCKIVVDTVEEFVQHSGVIWKVILAPTYNECNHHGNAFAKMCSQKDDKLLQLLCTQLLTQRQQAKARMESEEFTKEKCIGATKRTPKILSESKDDANSVRSTRPSAARALCNHVPSTTCVATHIGHKSITNNLYTSAIINDVVVGRAEALGLRITDREIYPLFQSLREPGEEEVRLDRVVDIMCEKMCEPPGCPNVKSQKRVRTATYTTPMTISWPFTNKILSIDSCGVPCNRETVHSFVARFCRPKYNILYKKTRQLGRHDVKPVVHAPKMLNYLEFSMLMLGISYL